MRFGLASHALLFCCIAAAPTSTSINKTLDAFPRSDGVVNGVVEIGGKVDLPAGVITLTRPISLSSGQTLQGVGAATVLRWNGPPNSAAIVLTSHTAHGMVHKPVIRDLCISTPNGADALVVDRTVLNVEEMLVENVTANGGGFDYTGCYEGYFNCFRGISFRNPTGKVLHLIGQGHDLSGVRISGSIRNVGRPVPSAMIVCEGSMKIDAGAGWSRLEGDWPCPMLLVKNWQGKDHSIVGQLALGSGVWVEPYRPGVAVRLQSAWLFGTAMMGADADHPWHLDRFSKAFVQVGMADWSSLKRDPGSEVYVGGVKQP